jgi:hypothetical protein
MKLPPSLSAQLSALTDALDDPNIDLEAVLTALLDEVRMSVPSVLGLTMALELNGHQVSVTAIDPDRPVPVQASVQLPLDPLAGAGPGSNVVFYGRDPGAFDDLAIDARQVLGPDWPVALDRHLSTRAEFPGTPGIHGLRKFAAAHRTIGRRLAEGDPKRPAADSDPEPGGGPGRT